MAAIAIDPARFRFRAIGAPELLGRPSSFLSELSSRADPLVAVNASFFLPESYAPIGLIVSEGRVLNDWKPKGGSGVFRVSAGRASIEWARDYSEVWDRDELAIQAGPLLVEPDGRPGIYQDAGKRRRRTAVGLTRDGQAIMLCSKRFNDDGGDLSGLDLYELMEILIQAPDQGGLGVVAAINLDGGTSAAMSVRHPKLGLEIESVLPVANGIAIFRRDPAPGSGQN